MIKLLVIDDHPVTISGIKEILGGFAEIIYSSLNINDSLNFDSSKFDIIILDLFLNETNPVENVEILKRTYPNVPIVIFTCEDSVIWKTKMFNAGISSYIIKTSDKSEIKLVLENVINNKKIPKKKNYEYYFESLLNNMIEGVGIHQMIYDKNNNPIDYKILDVNTSYEKLLGLKKDDVINKLASEAYGSIPALKEYSDVVLNQKAMKFDFYYPLTKKYYRISASPWNDIGFVSIFSDITENLIMDQKYLNIFENSAIGMFQIKDGVFITVNDAFAKILGYTKEKLINHESINFYYKKENREKLLNILINKGEVINYITQAIKKDGEIIWVSINIKQIKDFENIDNYIEGSMIDISDRKLAENRLEESQKIAKIGNWEANLTTGNLYWSDVIYDIFGVDKDNFKPNIEFFREFVHPDDRYKVLESEKLSETTGFHDIIHRIILPNKDIKYVHELAIRHINNEEEILRGTVQDITDLKRAERLQILSNKILTVLNSNIDLKKMIDIVINFIKQETNFSAVGIRLKSGEDFPYFSQIGFTDDFIYAENSLISLDENKKTCKDENGKPLLECTCGLILSGKNKNHPVFTKTGSLWTNNSYSFLELNEKDDPRLNPRNTCIHYGFGSIALIPIKTNEINIGVLQLNHQKINAFNENIIAFFEGICLNIGMTLMRIYTRAELLKSKEKAENSEKLKMAFLSNMSHEIRTPINSIIGFSELLKDNNNKIEKLKYLDIIIQNGDILTNLINDIIDVTKIDSETLTVQLTEIDLNKLLQELKTQYSKLIQNNIKLIIDIDLNSNVFILSDKYRLKQILMNLLSNAVKFTKKGSIKFGYEILNNNIINIYIKDTGIGISEQNKNDIFNRFSHFDQPGTKEKGAGLGLTISKSLCKILNFGELKFNSELNKGSIFYFEAPYIIKDDGNYILEEKEDDLKLKYGNFNILIVEDDENFQFILKSYLKETKCKIFIDDGKQYMDVLKKQKINIVLLDLGLGNIDGFNILKDIKFFDENIIVIIQSAYAITDFQKKSFDFGADDFLPKPVTKQQLFNAINKLI